MSESITIEKELENAWNIVLLNKDTIQEVSKNKASTQIAYGIIIFGYLFSFLGKKFFINEYISFDFLIVFNIASAIVSIYLMSFIAKHVFKGKGDYLSFLRASGYGNLIVWFSMIPQISAIMIWLVVINFFVLKSIHQLNNIQSALTIICSMSLMLVFSGTIGLLIAFLNPFFLN